MKWKFVLLLSASLLMAACSQLPDKQPPAPPTPPLAESTVGVAAATAAKTKIDPAAQLQGWYNQTVTHCGNPGRPAFLCSGVMLRGTLSQQSYLPWDPSPSSITSGGVSFAWIRTDTNFVALPMNYNNGYIFYPVLDTPPGKNSDIQVLCSFPFDAWSDIRNQQGCGTNTQYPTQSRPCNDQGINTGQQWIAHFNASPDKYKSQCGWNVREGQRDTADRFYQSIDGRSRITSSHWNSNNELRLATWATGSGAQLPIQSFFYIAGSSGRASAQDDQRRYHSAYGQVVPVVQVSLAPNRNGKASFVYRESDQVIGDGGGADGTINFEDVPLQEGSQGFSTALGTFRLKDGVVGSMAVRDRQPPSHNISGHHLAIFDDWRIPVVLTPIQPVSRISLDAHIVDGNGALAFAVMMHLSDGTWTSVPTSSHLDYRAPAGVSIVGIQFGGPPHIAVDNIRLYK